MGRGRGGADHQHALASDYKSEAVAKQEVSAEICHRRLTAAKRERPGQGDAPFRVGGQRRRKKKNPEGSFSGL